MIPSLMTKPRRTCRTKHSIRTPASVSKEQCPLCRIIGNETVDVEFKLGRGKGPALSFFIVATKNRKGHKQRYMVVLRDHVPNILPPTESEAVARFFGFMKEFRVDFAIMESTHATIGDHWHRVGTDLDPSADDAKQITDTERFEVRFMKQADKRN